MGFIVGLYFFSPRYVLWQGLHILPSHFNPEVNRAYYSLQIKQHPAVDIPDNKSNTTVRWRLFFPLLGYYLHIPNYLFLCIPYIGVFFSLLAIAHLALKETQNRWQTLLITLLAATTSWFITSTGWLSYWDAWFVLSLLLVSFFDGRRALIYPCIFAPWIDERFLIGLPIAIIVRGYYLYDQQPGAFRKWANDFLVLCLALIPWVILRGMIVFGSIDNSDTFVRFAEHMKVPHTVLTTFLGGWHGLRGLWFFAFLLVYLLYRHYARIVGVGLVLLVIFLHVFGVYISGDVTRNVSEFFPLAILGIILGLRWCRTFTLTALPIVLAVNLILPYTHVMTGFLVPVYYFPYEWDHLWNPPKEVSPLTYTTRAEELIKEKKFDDALRLLGYSTRLRPDFARAYFNIGYIKYTKGQYEDALTDLTFCIRYDSRHADTYYYRGLCYLQLKNPANAASEFAYALRVAPPDWPLRTETSNRLQAIPKTP
ncbi:MAG: hypothetical protein B9S32_13275 [Verrucomicrobia bacterium Tous-C9LFEB]|nr:MAG: hypothetical protein B9S32_13275 [Verrucomicrobia bacterium Tous-C9LFEB]